MLRTDGRFLLIAVGVWVVSALLDGSVVHGDGSGNHSKEYDYDEYYVGEEDDHGSGEDHSVDVEIPESFKAYLEDALTRSRDKNDSAYDIETPKGSKRLEHVMSSSRNDSNKSKKNHHHSRSGRHHSNRSNHTITKTIVPYPNNEAKKTIPPFRKSHSVYVTRLPSVGRTKVSSSDFSKGRPSTVYSVDEDTKSESEKNNQRWKTEMERKRVNRKFKISSTPSETGTVSHHLKRRRQTFRVSNHGSVLNHSSSIDTASGSDGKLPSSDVLLSQTNGSNYSNKSYSMNLLSLLQKLNSSEKTRFLSSIHELPEIKFEKQSKYRKTGIQSSGFSVKNESDSSKGDRSFLKGTISNEKNEITDKNSENKASTITVHTRNKTIIQDVEPNRTDLWLEKMKSKKNYSLQEKRRVTNPHSWLKNKDNDISKTTFIVNKVPSGSRETNSKHVNALFNNSEKDSPSGHSFSTSGSRRSVALRGRPYGYPSRMTKVIESINGKAGSLPPLSFKYVTSKAGKVLLNETLESSIPYVENVNPKSRNFPSEFDEIPLQSEYLKGESYLGENSSIKNYTLRGKQYKNKKGIKDFGSQSSITVEQSSPVVSNISFPSNLRPEIVNQSFSHPIEDLIFHLTQGLHNKTLKKRLRKRRKNKNSERINGTTTFHNENVANIERKNIESKYEVDNKFKATGSGLKRKKYTFNDEKDYKINRKYKQSSSNSHELKAKLLRSRKSNEYRNNCKRNSLDKNCVKNENDYAGTNSVEEKELEKSTAHNIGTDQRTVVTNSNIIKEDMASNVSTNKIKTPNLQRHVISTTINHHANSNEIEQNKRKEKFEKKENTANTTSAKETKLNTTVQEYAYNNVQNYSEPKVFVISNVTDTDGAHVKVESDGDSSEGENGWTQDSIKGTSNISTVHYKNITGYDKDNASNIEKTLNTITESNDGININQDSDKDESNSSLNYFNGTDYKRKQVKDQNEMKNKNYTQQIIDSSSNLNTNLNNDIDKANITVTVQDRLKQKFKESSVKNNTSRTQRIEDQNGYETTNEVEQKIKKQNTNLDDGIGDVAKENQDDEKEIKVSQDNLSSADDQLVLKKREKAKEDVVKFADENDEGDEFQDLTNTDKNIDELIWNETEEPEFEIEQLESAEADGSKNSSKEDEQKNLNEKNEDDREDEKKDSENHPNIGRNVISKGREEIKKCNEHEHSTSKQQLETKDREVNSQREIGKTGLAKKNITCDCVVKHDTKANKNSKLQKLILLDKIVKEKSLTRKKQIRKPNKETVQINESTQEKSVITRKRLIRKPRTVDISK